MPGSTAAGEDVQTPVLVPWRGEETAAGDVTGVACGEGCTFVLTGNGHVYSWGDGGEGRLGLGDEKDARWGGASQKRWTRCC